MATGGMRAFLRRGKFAPTHSELEDFLTGRITRQQGMAHIRGALLASARNAKKLREETLDDLRAWDLVYLDHLAGGRLVPGEPSAAAEPLHGLNANEALLVRQAKSKRLVRNLPPIIQKSLMARVKKTEAVWMRDGKEYDKLFGRVPSPKSKVQSRKKRREPKKTKAKPGTAKRKKKTGRK